MNAKVDQSSTVTITAVVTASHPLTAGNLQFFDYNNFIGTFPLNGNQAVLGEPGNFLGLGIHQITAKYAGDVNNLASTSNMLTQFVIGTTTANVQGNTGVDVHSLQATVGVQ
jgi:Bacterial Ig-like domain (group 3)